MENVPAIASSAYSIASGGTLQFDTPSGVQGGVGAVSVIGGGGVYLKTGPGLWDLLWHGGNSFQGPNEQYPTYVRMSPGALIDVEGGTLELGWGAEENWTANQAGLKVAGGATFDFWDSVAVSVDALTGAGTVQDSWNVATLTVGVAGGSGSFSGVIQQNAMNLVKNGSGTQTLNGTISYTGSTTVNNGTLVISPNSNALLPSAALTIAGGAMLQIAYNNANTAGFQAALITGGGTLQKTGTGNWVLGFDGGSANAVSMGSGALIERRGRHAHYLLEQRDRLDAQPGGLEYRQRRNVQYERRRQHHVRQRADRRRHIA